ncbi:MAG TPA: hypothetical protein VMD99_04655 [Terriglobales bacterium]|nr:hypothetical protein [Terriglobales bacterium]
MAVRPLAEADIPQVVDLYWKYMRKREGSAPPALRTTFHNLYFINPFVDPAFPPLVYEDKGGKIVGFLGTVVRKMNLCGEPIRVAFGGNLVVHPDSRSHLAAPRLLGTFMAGNQDLSLTDSANDLSRKLIERLGFHAVPALNIHWARPLRPSHYLVYALSRATGPAVATTLKIVSKPFCAVADGLAARLSFSPFRQTTPALQGAEADVETLLQCQVEFRQTYSLWPEYDAQSLKWLLNFMDHMPVRGDLRKIVLRDAQQKIVGWYIYYVKRGAIGEVVQVGGNPKSTKNILDHLFHDARQQGVIGLHGVVDSRRMADFSDKNCLFTCRGGWSMAHSRNLELLDVLDRGAGFLSRLDGEWCLDPGE